MSKENIQKAIQEKIAAAQLLAQEYPQYITAEKTKTLEKMVAIFQKMIVKPIMSASMPQGEMGSMTASRMEGEMEDITPQEFHKQYLTKVQSYLKSNIIAVYMKGKYVKLKDMSIIGKCFVIDNPYYKHIAKITDVLQGELYELFDKEAIVSSDSLKMLVISKINEYVFNPFTMFTNKEHKNEYKKLLAHKGEELFSTLKDICDGLILDLIIIGSASDGVTIDTIEEWVKYNKSNIDEYVNTFAYAAKSESELGKVKKDKTITINDKIPFTSMKLNHSTLESITTGIAIITDDNIAQILIKDISEKNSYLEVVNRFQQNFSDLIKSKDSLSKIEGLLKKGKEIDIYEIISTCLGQPTIQWTDIPDIHNTNINIENKPVNNNEVHGPTVNIENPKESTPENKEDTKKDVRSTPILTIGDVAITYDTSSEDHKRILNNYLDKKVTNNINVHKPFTRINNYAFEFFILRDNASSNIKEVYVVHDKQVNSMLVSSNIIIESSAENSCELSLNLTFISNSKIEREENSGQTNSEHQLSLSSSFGVWVAGFFGYTVGAGKLELDGAYDYFKQYVGANTITKETFEKSQTFKVTLFFRVNFDNNPPTITRIFR